jgi:hypothetical protein
MKFSRMKSESVVSAKLNRDVALRVSDRILYGSGQLRGPTFFNTGKPCRIWWRSSQKGIPSSSFSLLLYLSAIHSMTNVMTVLHQKSILQLRMLKKVPVIHTFHYYKRMLSRGWLVETEIWCLMCGSAYQRVLTILVATFNEGKKYPKRCKRIAQWLMTSYNSWNCQVS